MAKTLGFGPRDEGPIPSPAMPVPADTRANIVRVRGVTVWCIYDLGLGRTRKHLDRTAFEGGGQAASVDQVTV